MGRALKSILEHYPDEHFLKLDGYDDCIVGIDSNLCLVYDQELIIEKLSNEMPIEEAIEYFHFNIVGSHMGEGTPVYIELHGRYTQ